MSEVKITVKKGNVSFKWNKVKEFDGLKVIGYNLEYNGELFFVRSNSYTVKNAEIGNNHTVRVQAVTVSAPGDWSAPQNFAVKDVMAPKAGKLVVKQTSQSSVELSFKGFSDNDAVDHYNIYLGNKLIGSTGDSSYDYSGDELGGKLNFAVEAVDKSGNRSKAAKASIKIADQSAPEQVENLRVEGKATEKATVISWDVPHDNVGAVAYLVKVGNKVYTSKKNSITLKKLSAGTHSIVVTALDKAKNAGSASEEFTFVVQDTVAPKKGKIKLEQLAQDSIKIAFNGFSDQVGVVEYKIYLNDTLIGTTAGNSYTYNGSKLGGTLNFAVRAVDEAGNESAPAAAKIKLADKTAPDQVTNVRISGEASGKATTLVWDIPADNVGVVSYRITVDGKTFTSRTNSITLKNLAGGNHSVSVAAIDKAKNIGVVSEKLTFAISAAPAPDPGTGGSKGLNMSVGGIDFDLFMQKYSDWEKLSELPANGKFKSITGTAERDVITFTANKYRFVNGNIQLGAGDDAIIVEKSSIAEIDKTVDFGEGNNTLTVTGKDSEFICDDASVIFGSGNDTINFDAASFDFEDGCGFFTGGGNDVFNISNNADVSCNGLIDMGNGNDTLKISGDSLVEVPYLQMGSGNDSLNIGKGAICEVEYDDESDFYGLNMGDGNDTLIIDGTVIFSYGNNYNSLFSGVENISGSGSVVVSCKSQLSDDIIDKIEDSNIKIVEVPNIWSFMDGGRSENADDTMASARAIDEYDEDFDVWLCSESVADSMENCPVDTVDWFRLDIGSNGISADDSIYFSNSYAGEAGFIQLDIYDKNGSLLTEVDPGKFGKYSDPVIDLKDYGNGTIYLKFSISQGNCGNLGFYVLNRKDNYD